LAFRVIVGDMRSVLPTLLEAGEVFDGVLCDPPYEIGFMGHAWDRSGVAFDPKTWSLISSVLRPGSHVMAFGGTRTYHRLTCAVEDGGFELRDCLMWLYGEGLPKSLNVSKAIDKAAGATREVVGTRPIGYPDSPSGGAAGKTRSVSANASHRGDGIWRSATSGETSHGRPVTAPATPDAVRFDGYGTAFKPAWEPILLARYPLDGTVTKNAVMHGTGALNIAGGRLASGRWPPNVVLDEEAADLLGEPSRFFYVGKAPKKERSIGCTHKNEHRTVKPLSLTTWLATLMLPPTRASGGARRLLVPFAGSGSEMIGALRAGWEEVVGIELDEGHAATARERLTYETASRNALKMPTEIAMDEVCKCRRVAGDSDDCQVHGTPGRRR
jgi:hypothetical protein